MSNELVFFNLKGKSVNKYLLSLLLLLPITFTFAQDESSEEEVENVVVLGVKQSLIDAIELKRSKVGVTEAISAEDIGKFPDQNLAESLGRIAGITIDRSNVEGSRVNVRGLGYMFNNVTLNGRSMPNVAGQYEHGRGFDFGDISSHGVSAVEVYKSSNSVLPSGGIGATINMITTKPLITGDAASFSVRAVNDTKVVAGDEVTPEFDFLVSTSNEMIFGDYTLPYGFSLSGSYQERHNREVGTNEITWVPNGYGYDRTSVVETQLGTGRADGQVFLPEAVGLKAKDNERIRENLQATYQIALGDKTTVTIDHTESSVDFSTTGRVHTQYWGGFDITSTTISDNGAVIMGSIPSGVGPGGHGNTYGMGVTYGDSVKENVSQGINIEYVVNDSLSFQLDYHESTSDLEVNGDNTIEHTPGAWWGDAWYAPQQYVALGDRTLDLSSGLPVLESTFCANTGSPCVVADLTAQDVAPNKAYMSAAEADGELTQFQFIGEWVNNMESMSALKSVDFGVSKISNNYSNANAAYTNIAGNSAEGDASNLLPEFVPDSIYTMTDVSSWTGDLALGNLPWAEVSIEDSIYWIERAGMTGIGLFEQQDGGWWLDKQDWHCTANDAIENGVNTGWSAPTGAYVSTSGNENGTMENTSQRGVLCAGDTDSSHQIDEVTESMFVNLNFETDINGMPLNAQIGVRYEEISRVSTSVATVPVNTVWGFGDYNGGGYSSTGAYGLQLITELMDYSASTSETYLLPSINISLGLNDNEVIRFGISETNAQPSLWQVRAGFEMDDYASWNSVPGLRSGNPNLKPYTSENIDFAYENYYAEGSYFAVNIFQKEISDYHGADSFTAGFNNVPDVFNSRAPANPGATCYDPNWGDVTANVPGACWANLFEWNGYTHPTAESTNGWPAGTYAIDSLSGVNWIAIGDSSDDLLLFEQTTPINKYNSTLKGIELSIQHFFVDTPYGIQANITKLDSGDEADPYNTGEQSALPGFGNGANFSVFYEDEKYSARLSYNWRDESYAGEDQYNPLFIEARGQLDFNASYVINDNAVVFIEGLNISDQDVRLFSRYKEMLFLYQDHGPIYKAGIRYKF